MKKENIWIEKGYETFAKDGPKGLMIERLSKSVGKNKSSFYHYFSDLEIFICKLLDYHISIVKIIAEKEAAASNETELIEVFVAHKTDLLFNRQLRVNRENNDFQSCFLKTNEISKPAILPIWKKIIGLNENHYLAEMVFVLSIENFFLQITDETLNKIWLVKYFDTIKALVGQLKIDQNLS